MDKTRDGIEKEINEIIFSELEQWNKKHMDYIFEEMQPQAIQFRSKFQTILNSIKILAKQLDETEIDENEVAQQYIPVINDAKSTILSTIQKETSDQLHEINTFDDVLVLRDRIQSLLNKLGGTGGSHSRTIHSFFGKQAKILKVELGFLDKEIKRLNELIDHYNESIASITDCGESMTRISYAQEIQNEYMQKQRETRKELESLRTQETDLVKNIDDFKNTEEFNVCTKSKKELADVNNILNNVLVDLNGYFSRISRPLSKYTYEIGLDKESNYLMQSIIMNPVNLMHDSRADQVIEVLKKVMHGIQKGRIKTKNPEKDVENINGLITNLHNYVKRYKEYDSLIIELQNKTSIVDNKLEVINEELRRIRDSTQQKESYLNGCDTKLSNAESTINEELEKISQGIERTTGSRVKIVI